MKVALEYNQVMCQCKKSFEPKVDEYGCGYTI